MVIHNISPDIYHCISFFVRSPFRTAIVWHFLAELLPMPALASSSARSCLITAHSCFASRSGFISMFGHCISTLVLCQHFQWKSEEQFYAGSFLLICLEQDLCPMTSWGDDKLRLGSSRCQAVVLCSRISRWWEYEFEIMRIRKFLLWTSAAEFESDDKLRTMPLRTDRQVESWDYEIFANDFPLVRCRISRWW